ncbi:phosphatase PAP2 family protein [Lactobacillus pasteurii]|uniref:Membrane-associated phospholipid phosphatase n=1 Tax=Lactobacillus pasteurii DSM 23907 = CRBIP 24.76 TaxID=1423790 RepID=I7JZ09_9LACO|nr:phosphatase PAP2 family protein [Lactobacillus pasteurii]TDG76336.1 hypothetical protein C5L33_001095 [Lactobacillus pasteurii]CCI85940.1 Membrane-associated phospholipid phosphatase [Lactobacillus pasteurii DSM 23907 = CRBIP 24.76]
MHKEHNTSLYLGLIGFLIFCSSLVLHAGWIGSFDQMGQDFAQNFDRFEQILTTATLIAEPKFDLVYMAIIVAGLFFLKKKFRLPALSLAFALILGDGIGTIVKKVVHRARPIGHLSEDTGFSFPSGHVLGMAIIIFWLILIFLPIIVKKMAFRLIIDLLLLFALAIVMISRVYLLAHYPSDVFGSFFLALAVIGLAKLILHLVPHGNRTNRINY